MEAASERLAALAAEYWEAHLANQPVFATQLGDRRYDDRLADLTPEGLVRIEAQSVGFLERAKAIREDALEPAERVSWTALLEDLAGKIEYLRCHLEEWRVDPLGGPPAPPPHNEAVPTHPTPPGGRAPGGRRRAGGTPRTQPAP